MDSTNASNCKSKGIKKFSRFQLAAAYKPIGRMFFCLFFLSLFINAFTINNLVFREIIKYGLLVSLLIISLTKEPIEDELIVQIRMQSYAYAFIGGIFFVLLQPILNYVVDLVSEGHSILKPNGDWLILWILLFSQVTIFETLKFRHQ